MTTERDQPVLSRVLLLGGPFDGWRVGLVRTPPRIEVLGVIYRRIDDPETGVPLGGYGIDQPEPFEVSPGVVLAR